MDYTRSPLKSIAETTKAVLPDFLAKYIPFTKSCILHHIVKLAINRHERPSVCSIRPYLPDILKHSGRLA